MIFGVFWPALINLVSSSCFQRKALNKLGVHEPSSSKQHTDTVRDELLDTVRAGGHKHHCAFMLDLLMCNTFSI